MKRLLKKSASERFKEKLKSFNGIMGLATTLLPGISFFLKYSPPLFDGISILTTILCVAFLWIGFNNSSNNSVYEQQKYSLRFILLGFALSITYLIMLDNTTVRIKTDDFDARFQVGWNVSDWSLTPDAVNKIRNKTCLGNTKENLFYCYTISRQNSFLIWKPYVIYLLGILNIVIFAGASLTWSYGWGYLINTT